MTTTLPHWVFDDSPIDDPLGFGERAVRFFSALKHPKSAHPDKRFDLPPFWERIVRRIYGPRDPRGRRIVRTVFCMMPRGARKTSVVAGGLGLLHAVGHERLPGGQVLLGAGAEDQAMIGFEEACGIVKATPALHRAIRLRGDYLQHPPSGSTLRVMSAEGDVAHGTSPSAVLLDELHVFRNRKLWRALKTGLPKTPGSILIITTTAGRGQTGLAWEEFEYAARVARGEIVNPSYLPVIFEPPVGADWHDEEIWRLVNPGLDLGFPDIEELRAAAAQAAEKPGDLDDFKQYNLNFWLDQSASPFVAMDVYDEGAEPTIDLAALRDRPCWLGVDLSSNTDLTVIVAAWRDDEDGYIVHPWFFCPADNLRARSERDGVPYQLWERHGLITATPGNVVDFRAVEQKVRDLCAEFDVQEIGFDPHLARVTLNNLLDDGLPAVEVRQGWVTMAPAIKELERAIVGRKLKHGGHPILRWNFANVAVERDKADNKSFHKGKSRDRIDGAVAVAMAVGRASLGEQEERSIFDRPELWSDDAQPAAPGPAEDDAVILAAGPRHPQWQAARERYERAFLHDEDF